MTTQPHTDAGRAAVAAIKSGALGMWADDPSDPIAAMIASVEVASSKLGDVEAVHDIVEWLGTDIEFVMRTPGEEPHYQQWIESTVQAHVILARCENHVVDRLAESQPAPKEPR